MNVVFIIIGFAVVTIYEVPKMLSQKLYRELAVSSAILSLGFLVALLYVFGVDVPNPFRALDMLVNWAKQFP